MQPLARWHGCCKNHKGNTTLTVLSLEGNSVGVAGAAALADALQATVLTCRKCVCVCVFMACVNCYNKCRFAKSSEELASTTCFAVRVAAFVILLVVCWKSFTHVCVEGIARGLCSS